MKLLLFILTIALCTATPSLKRLHDVNKDVDVFAFEQDNVPRWLQDSFFSSQEAIFGSAEEENIFNDEEGDITQGFLVDIRENDVVNDIFDFGFDSVIAQGINRTRIPDKVYTVANVTVFSVEPSNRGKINRFTVTAISEDGTSVVNMNFTVIYDAANERRTLSTYSYTVTTTRASQTEDIYVEVPESEANNTDIQDALNYGVEQLLQRGYESGRIPVSSYAVSRLVTAAKMSTNDRDYYKFSVELQDANQVQVKAQFTVVVNTATQEKTFSAWSYQVSNIRFSINDAAFVPVNPSEAQSNPQIKNALDYAIRNVVRDWQQYTRVDTNAVWVQTVNGIIYYKFDARLDNTRGRTVNLAAIVAYDPETGALDVRSHSTRTSNVTPRG